MKILEEIDIKKGDVVSIVGAGGKTSVMNKLASELKEKNLRVLVTSTTAIMMPKKEEYDYFYLEKEYDIKRKVKTVDKGSITVLVKEFIREDKVKGIEIEYLDNVIKEGLFDIILIEADGARRKTIKAPREDEPLLTKYTNKLIGIFGIDSLGLTIDSENVHRTEIFLEIIGKTEGDIIENRDIVKLIESKVGLFKGGEKKEKYLIMNKCDNIKEYNKALEIKTEIKTQLKNIIILSIKEDKIWK